MMARVVREVCLLGLLAAVTWMSVGGAVPVNWTSVDYAGQPDWVWAVIAGVLVVGLLRLWVPSVALLGAALLFGWWPVCGVAVALTAFEVAGRVAAGWRRSAALGSAVVVGYVVSLFSADLGWRVVTAFHAVAAVVCVGLPVATRLLLGRVDRLVRALRERARYLEENYRLADSAARLQERSRIAQEMHDQLGHRLSLISLYAGALELSTTGRPAREPAEAGDEARLIRGTVHTAMQELRSILGVLRSVDRDGAALQPVERAGTRADVTALVAQSRSAGAEVNLVWQGTDSTDVVPEVRRAVHRVVREGLTNAHRHAPGSVVRVVVERGSDRVRVQVCNGGDPDGGTRPSAGTGLGLVGLQERVGLLGGVFSARPSRDGGFRVVAELPLRPTHGAAEQAVDVAPPDGVPTRSGWSSQNAARGGRRAPWTERWTRPAAAVSTAAGLIGVAAVIGFVLEFIPYFALASGGSDQAYVSPFDAVHAGMTRAEVLQAIGSDDPMARLAARSLESPPPAGTNCLYGQEWLDEGQGWIERYCFQHDQLVRKDRFDIPTAEGAHGS